MPIVRKFKLLIFWVIFLFLFTAFSSNGSASDFSSVSALVGQSKYKEARELLNKAIENYPDNTKARQLLEELEVKDKK